MENLPASVVMAAVVGVSVMGASGVGAGVLLEEIRGKKVAEDLVENIADELVCTFPGISVTGVLVANSTSFKF